MKVILFVIALLLGVIALRPLVDPATRVSADAARFDHVYIAASGFLYKGQQGLLLLDRRNGNVWFLARTADAYQNQTFQNPVYITRVPLEKLDQSPPG